MSFFLEDVYIKICNVLINTNFITISLLQTNVALPPNEKNK